MSATQAEGAQELLYIVVKSEDDWECTIATGELVPGMHRLASRYGHFFAANEEGEVRASRQYERRRGHVIPQDRWLTNKLHGFQARVFTSTEEANRETRKIEDPYHYLKGAESVLRRWAMHNLPPAVYSLSGLRCGSIWEFFLTDTREMFGRTMTLHRVPWEDLNLHLEPLGNPGLGRGNTWEEEAMIEQHGSVRAFILFGVHESTDIPLFDEPRRPRRFLNEFDGNDEDDEGDEDVLEECDEDEEPQPLDDEDYERVHQNPLGE